MKIYTKTGDEGLTSLYDGSRVPKQDRIFEALGDLDELNCYLGMAYNATDETIFPEIMRIIMDISSYIATPTNPEKIPLDEEIVPMLESEIDRLTESLPKLTKFILPDNHIHTARAVCRRAERHICFLFSTFGNEYEKEDLIRKFINRLSDFLFQRARKYSLDEGYDELTK